MDMIVKLVPKEGFVGPDLGVEIVDVVEESKIVKDLENDGRDGASEGS